MRLRALCAAVSLIGLGLAWPTIRECFQAPASARPSAFVADLLAGVGGAQAIPAARYELEVIVDGAKKGSRKIEINTTSQATRDQCVVYPGAARAKSLLAAGMPGACAPLEPGNPSPAVRILDKVIIIDTEQLIVDGQEFELPPDTEKVTFWERDGAIRVLAGATEVLKFMR
jgi:hypothetical protein